MQIAVLKERKPGESRVAATPDSAKRLIGLGFEVVVETGAGEGASFADAQYRDAGATLVKTADEALKAADIVLKVQPPIVEPAGAAEVGKMKKGAILIGMLSALTEPKIARACAEAGLTAFAMELLPRITRAQSMDVLSSQANLAGYKSVLDAAGEFGRAFPMMMTAAGTIPPAKVLVLGCGVAGLQAIATARRLGAVVFGYDVRAASKQEVESLGAKFVEVDPEAAGAAQTAGGYAKEMGEDYGKKQAAVLADALKKQDIAICTALIPGKAAPRLITKEMVAAMKPGSVIVDLAVEAGGNCELSELDKVVVKHGVKIVGHGNVPSRLAQDASMLYARNLFNFVKLITDPKEKTLKIDWEDEIVNGALATRDGSVVHPRLKGA
ncbi:MAG: Re/Si-specific NAD(P)(+) transhydrogenase subunit alpha [Rhodospirillales bacterium]|nr:Re/Si-specific NAD(P)(+) transhydrogenase subunit alpha [Rhodospirillales bacterium]